MNALTGAMTALITPFKYGKLDLNSYEKLIERQIENGIDVVVPVGTTGESATLTHEEHQTCIKAAVEVCRGTKTKVLAGAGSNSTREAMSLAQFAESNGADGILSVTPYYNKPTQEGLYQHFASIAKSINIPILLYNVPGRTAADLLPSTVERLFRDFDNIYGIKEATGSMARTVELLARMPELAVISGDDMINYPILANGGKGVISVTSNILPNEISALVHHAMNGELEKAKALNDHLFEINRDLFCESNPIPIKAAMYMASLIESLEYRLPLVPPSGENMKKIEETLKKYAVKGF
jgi:4-hydroxy-tetrahydrodipicolinate synthase